MTDHEESINFNLIPYLILFSFSEFCAALKIIPPIYETLSCKNQIFKCRLISLHMFKYNSLIRKIYVAYVFDVVFHLRPMSLLNK